MDEMVKIFGEEIKEALDVCAPMKRIKLKKGHRYGISQETKELMKERDKARKDIKRSPNERKSTILKIFHS